MCRNILLPVLVDKQKEGYYAFGDEVIYLAAALGEKKTSGYSIHFVEYIVNEDQTWDVYLEIKSPGRDEHTAQVLTYPVAYARLYPESELPIQRVRFHYDDKLLADLSVTEIEFTQTEVSFDLYFGSENAYLRIEPRLFPSDFLGKNVNIQAEILIDEVLKGPIEKPINEGKTIRVIPEGARMLSADYIEDELLLKITVSSQFTNVQGSAGEMLAVYALVNTLTQIEGVDYVTILIEEGELLHLDQLEKLNFNED